MLVACSVCRLDGRRWYPWQGYGCYQSPTFTDQRRLRRARGRATGTRYGDALT
jgi:hypothetical protein